MGSALGITFGLIVIIAYAIFFGRATGRYFSTPLSGLILLVGYFMIGWTLRKQGLHDKIARTIHLIEFNK